MRIAGLGPFSAFRDPHLRSLSLLEAREMSEPGIFDQLQASFKIAGDFGWMVGIRREGDGDVGPGGESEEFGGRVLLGAGFVKACGIELDGDIFPGDGLNDRVVKAAEVAGGTVGKFFDQVGVAQEVEKPRLGHGGVFLPVKAPDLLNVSFSPAPEPFWIVKIPFVAEVVDRSNKVIPIVLRGEVVDPVSAVGEPVALQPGTNGEFLTSMFPGTRDPIEVLGKILLQHPPLIERLGSLRSVVGNAVFGEVCGDGLIDVFLGFAFGMQAKRRVGVVICEHGCFGVVGGAFSY